MPLAELATRRFAYNEALSQSGWAAPATHFAQYGLTLPHKVRTGAHRASALAVVKGDADWAALDALTWQMVRRFDDFAVGLAVHTHTEPTPALPYVTAVGRDPVPIFNAMRDAIAALSTQDRDCLGIHGLVEIPKAAYLAVPTPAAP